MSTQLLSPDAVEAPASVVDSLGLTPREPNAFHRLQQRIGASRAGAWLYGRILDPTDSAIFATTGGRFTMAGPVAGVPVVMLTTTGAKSGRLRTAPVIGIPIDGDIAVLGTNFARRHSPGWIHNLTAEPRAELTRRDRRVLVEARPVHGSDFDDVFEAGAHLYSGYRDYRERITGREIRGFRLALRAEAGADGTSP